MTLKTGGWRACYLALAPALAVTLAGCGANSEQASTAQPSVLRAMGVTTAGTGAYLADQKLIAVDGNPLVLGAPYIYNDWGGHQPRITRHSDGTMRVLYIRRAASGLLEWRLMKRPPNATEWLEEKTGESVDDVVLMRDPHTDLAYVLAFPSGTKPTVYASPAFNGSVIPGAWKDYGVSARHYTGTGVGPDGTVCLKASVEVDTSNTRTDYICGKYDGVSAWTWNSQVQHQIDWRHTYDYLFPGGYGDNNRLVASSQTDVHKDVAGFPNAQNTTWVFNGSRQYQTGISNDTRWSQNELYAPYTAVEVQTAPTARQIDSFIDSKKRMFSSYYVEPTPTSVDRGFYLSLTNENGDALFNARWTQLPQYGAVRIFEDKKNRLWLLWTAQNTNLMLFPIIENPTGPSFTLGTGVPLGNQLAAHYWIQGALLAVPRGGQSIANDLDGVLVACTNDYLSPNTGNVCTPSNVMTQKIIYFRIHLPD